MDLQNDSLPWLQDSWGQHGAHLGQTGPRWAPCWPHEFAVWVNRHRRIEEFRIKIFVDSIEHFLVFRLRKWIRIYTTICYTSIFSTYVWKSFLQVSFMLHRTFDWFISLDWTHNLHCPFIPTVNFIAFCLCKSSRKPFWCKIYTAMCHVWTNVAITWLWCYTTNLQKHGHFFIRRWCNKISSSYYLFNCVFSYILISTYIAKMCSVHIYSKPNPNTFLQPAVCQRLEKYISTIHPRFLKMC